MAALDRGLYEVLITEALESQLSRLGDELEAIARPRCGAWQNQSGYARQKAKLDRVSYWIAHTIPRKLELPSCCHIQWNVGACKQ
jgi:hypothetical protein